MSYPPPPGLKASVSSSQPHSSLPARPLPQAAPLPSFKPAFSANPPSAAPGTGGGHGSPGVGGALAGSAAATFAAFKPRQLGGTSQDWSSHGAVVTAAPAPPAGFSAPTTYAAGAYEAGPSQAQQHYPHAATDYGAATTPQIRNPFPLPGQGGFQDVDPEMEAQIAQWQSAYAGGDSGDHSTAGRRGFSRFGGNTAEGPGAASGANAGPLGGRSESGAAAMTSSAVASAADGDTGVAAVVHGPDGKQKTVVRTGGGQSWTDTSLLEWDPAHFRLFVGNLAGEVTDESLLKAFNKFPSVQKARVVRDKRSTKSKGYGFVSFSDGDEYFRAARDMQGKYIGSHPVLLRRSTTEIRPVVPTDNKKGKGGKYGKGRKGGGNQDGRAKTGAGVQKKSSKTKGGLRVLG
ncbi:MAG: hypothetical protein M1832_001482 [Thelocarpon impressellum]|nr:MAG: hypothetical protein M1832_001482 [Thelocarpon impressellum]